jgi:hypothetical protein
MSRRDRSSHNNTITVGWLFADLLLALAMIFLIANTTNSAPKIVAKATPTPIPTATLSPTPTPIPRLETSYQPFVILIDSEGLLNGDQNAINQVKQQIRAQHFLQGRNAGLVIVYGGAPTTDDIETAKKVASRVYDVMRSLGKEHFAFSRASYYDPLFNLGASTDEITIHVFLFQN